LSDLKLGEAIEGVIIEALMDGMVMELETIELDENDGVLLPAPRNDSYYDYPVKPPLPVYPAVIVLADGAGSDEPADSAGTWEVKQRVFITMVCGDRDQSILHKKCKRYLLAAFKTILASQKLPENGYTLIAPWNIEYMPQMTTPGGFTEDGSLEITIDSLEG